MCTSCGYLGSRNWRVESSVISNVEAKCLTQCSLKLISSRLAMCSDLVQCGLFLLEKLGTVMFGTLVEFYSEKAKMFRVRLSNSICNEL